MIAMLLASQLAAQPLHLPSPAGPAQSRGDLIRVSPRAKTCFGGAGRMEVSFAEPAALYRRGDRPPKAYLNWADYPDGRLCTVEDRK
jgi:hypothetical protein